MRSPRTYIRWEDVSVSIDKHSFLHRILAVLVIPFSTNKKTTYTKDYHKTAEEMKRNSASSLLLFSFPLFSEVSTHAADPIALALASHALSLTRYPHPTSSLLLLRAHRRSRYAPSPHSCPAALLCTLSPAPPLPLHGESLRLTQVLRSSARVRFTCYQASTPRLATRCSPWDLDHSRVMREASSGRLRA